MAAALLDPHLARREVELVMENDEVPGRQLVKAHRLAHRLAREVHEGFGLEQHDLLAPEPTLADLETALAVGLLAFVLIKTTKFVLKIRKETFRYEIGDR